MSTIDFIWMIAWFVTGLITFEVTRAKRTLGTISAVISFLSFFTLILRPESLFAVFTSIGLSQITGIFTVLSYR